MDTTANTNSLYYDTTTKEIVYNPTTIKLFAYNQVAEDNTIVFYSNPATQYIVIQGQSTFEFATVTLNFDNLSDTPTFIQVKNNLDKSILFRPNHPGIFSILPSNLGVLQIMWIYWDGTHATAY